MAARALQPDPQEHLADALGGGHRVAIGAVEARRGVLPGGAQPGDDAADQLVERHVAGDLVAQPALQDPGALLAHGLLFVPEHVGPFERPEIGELGAIEQAINELLSFLRDRDPRERASFARLRQPADRIEKGPPQEHGSLLTGEGLIRMALSLAKTRSSIKPLVGQPRHANPGRSARKASRLVARPFM